jgi:hypothetical protein
VAVVSELEEIDDMRHGEEVVAVPELEEVERRVVRSLRKWKRLLLKVEGAGLGSWRRSKKIRGRIYMSGGNIYSAKNINNDSS